jgi:5-methylcytosine-specific restriction protein A
LRDRLQVIAYLWYTLARMPGRLARPPRQLQPLPRAEQLRPCLPDDRRIRGRPLQAIRERILGRDRGLCQCAECRQLGRLRFATLVDHITPIWAGGAESDENRQAIASECHLRKTAAEAGQRATAARLLR